MGKPKGSIAAGTVLSVGGITDSGSGVALTPIGRLSDAPLNPAKWQFQDVTSFDSVSTDANGNVVVDAEYLATHRADGSATWKFFRVSSDAGQAALVAASADGFARDFTVQLPKQRDQATTGDLIAFSAFVQPASLSLAPTKVTESSVDLKITGPFTITIGS